MQDNQTTPVHSKGLINNQTDMRQLAANALSNVIHVTIETMRQLFLLISIMLLLACSSETPKDKFHKELNAKIDNLINALKDFGPGTVEGKAQIIAEGKVSNGSSQISHSLIVSSAAKEVYDHLNYMKMDVYEDIKKATTNNPDWLIKISKDYSTRMLAIKNELEIIKSKVKAAPDAYKSSPNINGISLGEMYSYRTVRFDDNEVVFMTSDSQGIKLTDLMNIDMSNYLKTLSANKQN